MSKPEINSYVAAMGPGWLLLQIEVDGVDQMIDIYMDGTWIGSRRTIEQCYQAIGAAGGNVPEVYKQRLVDPA